MNELLRRYGAPLSGLFVLLTAFITVVVVISAWPLVTLLAGTGTMLALDGQRREILGFLSSAVSAEQFVNELLPILLRRFRSGTIQKRRALAPGTI